MIRFAFLVTFLYSLQLAAQDTISQYIVKSIPGTEFVKLSMKFDDDAFTNSIPPFLTNEKVIQVDYVYTTFRLDSNFDQIALNQKRNLVFKQQLSNSISNLTVWNSIAQSGAQTVSEAKNFFHGFVVYYRPRPTKESMEKEISFIDNIVWGENFAMDDKDSASVETFPPTGIKDAITTKADSSDISAITAIDENECYELDQKGIVEKTPAEFKQFCDEQVKNIDYQISYSFTESRKSTGKTKYTYSIYKKREECIEENPMIITESGMIPEWLKHADYGVVQAAFERNPQWKNTLVVMDVTGSMSPYIAKTMAWVKASHDSSQISSFVFFNDGDNTPNNEKRKGNVFGIYMSDNEKFNQVYKTMKHTMKMGGGGDAPENNVEASIRGVLFYPTVDELIMVADNWATPRDLSILDAIKRPVHVILCGATAGINESYLQLAYETGGSVHTIEEDLEMRNIEAGKQFQIGDTYYTVLDGRIVKAKHK